jgi:hypothetical protein
VHPLGVEEGTVKRDCVTHRADEAGAIAVEERDDHLFELVSMAQPVTPSMQPSIHQPSRMLRLGTPLMAAFSR